ncbi:hypothetical protein EBU71_05890 [bacterium]|nr:hypothetical protein [Candidatus Elulimicrobium humile]
MKKILAALLFVVSACSFAQIVTIPIPGTPGLNMTVGTGVNALPLQDIRNNANAVNITTSDDWYNEVPLGFTFPMFGQNFTTSWAATNGFVTFQNPQTSGLWGGCCSGVDLRNTTDPRYNYTIYGLHTDLYSWNGQNQYYLREGNSMTYGWYNVSQCCSSQGGNSFEIKINSSGLIDTRIAGAMVSWNAVTSGVAGDLSKGEYYQYYHGQGLNITPGSSAIFSWQALGGTGQGVDQCTINPLYSPSCPGYTEAYKTQQCTISALYDPTCPGYQQAYFNQQCSLNSLYNQSCPGYQQAYFTQQCTANPLYNVDCPGYQQAYFNQQCSLSALYSPSCPGYDVAYQAFLFNQACQANPQSSPRCSGYVTPVASSPMTTTTTSSTSSTTPQLVSDPVVNQTITTTSTSTAPTAPAAPVQLTTSTTSTQQTTTALAVESVQSSSTSSSSSSSSTSTSSTGSTGSTGSTTTTQSPRQSLQQARMEAAKREAAAKGNEAVKEGNEAKSMGAQIATQGLVIAAMGYNPSFDVYQSVIIKDASFYKPYTIYGGQKNVDNARAGRRLFGATDQLHNQMVQSQFELGK